ncbi:MAG: hypothetical protein LLF90_11610 [Methanomicrobiaceae archaeon]|uniref:outer membrane protein assembly factor BamB family protein n=1 Tax=Methanoculleus sp. TaxID=90427 RepID=UPI00320EC727|nr:hypothetical protein [Methanomicrobiaceae archaeon]
MKERNRYFRQPPGTIMAALFVAVMLTAVVVSAAETAPPVAWNVTFSPEENNKFDAVANTADGGYIALGSALTQIYGGREDLLLLKTDDRGNEVWMQRLPAMAPVSVAESADGSYIVAAYNATAGSEQNFTHQGSSLLIRTDAAGKEEWRQVLPGEKVSAVQPTADGGYVVSGWLWNPPGSADDTTAVITKTDSNGTPIWNQTFPGAAANTGITTADGGYIIGGTKSPFNNDRGDAFLIRLDADGNILWKKNYAAPVIFDVKETGDGGFVYSGNYWYGLVDAQGEEIWIRNIEGLAGYAVALRPAGGYMVAGTDIRSGEGFALGTDADGAVQWNTTFPGARVYAACSAPGGYTLAGIRFLSPDTSAAWLVNLKETAGPTPAAPGFGAAAAGAALLLLLAGRKRRG